MTSINTNLPALQAQNALEDAKAAQEKAMERLSTGKKINRASDDAAGLAIATRMQAQIKGLRAAVKNAQDGISLTQSAEGALDEVSTMLLRLRELALQAASGTNNAADRVYLNDEVGQLKIEIDRVATTTRFNDNTLFKAPTGSAAGTPGYAEELQIGAKSDETVTITISDMTTGTLFAQAKDDAGDPIENAGGNVAGAADVDISTMEKAQLTVKLVDAALELLNKERSGLGAMQNRLEYTISNLTNITTNTELAKSRIMDADYAEEASNMTRGQILSQAATAMLAQANKMAQGALALLQPQ
jgi:flagellin